jgi:hypothetical protein
MEAFSSLSSLRTLYAVVRRKPLKMANSEFVDSILVARVKLMTAFLMIIINILVP